jgi:spore germination protein KA
VLGSAIVKAGLVSPQMIIVVTFTALAVFTTPDFAMSAPWRILMWVFVFAAWLLGVYGIMIMTFFLVAYMARLSSIGLPYLAPAGPVMGRDLTMTFGRIPLWARAQRPEVNEPIDVQSKSDYRQPDPKGGLDSLRTPVGRKGQP